MMNRRVAASCCAIALAACAVATSRAETSAAPAALTAAQIADRNATARGGLAAWRAVGAMTMKGELDAGGKRDTRLPFTTTLQRPNKSRTEIRFADQTAVQVYDGTQGWKLRPFLNRDEVEPYTAQEAKDAAGWDELDGPLLDHARKGIKVEVAGSEPVDGKPAYRLKLTSRDGRVRSLWIDATTFLELKVDGEPRRFDGRLHNVAVYYRDWKAVNGLMMPHEFETVVQGVKPSHKLSIQSVKFNPAVDAAMFAKPKLDLIKQMP